MMQRLGSRFCGRRLLGGWSRDMPRLCKPHQTSIMPERHLNVTHILENRDCRG
jgi:hypothetical protein